MEKIQSGQSSTPAPAGTVDQSPQDGVALKNAKKTRGKPFEKHNKHGKGRPPGSRNEATVWLEKMAADDVGEVLKMVLAKAKAGDMLAAKLVLDRVLPPRKGSRVKISIPTPRTAAEVEAASAKVIEAACDGEITLDEAEILTALLEARRKVIETADLAVEHAELKRQLGLDQ